jgi:hypothetical protein
VTAARINPCLGEGRPTSDREQGGRSPVVPSPTYQRAWSKSLSALDRRCHRQRYPMPVKGRQIHPPPLQGWPRSQLDNAPLVSPTTACICCGPLGAADERQPLEAVPELVQRRLRTELVGKLRVQARLRPLAVIGPRSREPAPRRPSRYGLSRWWADALGENVRAWC